MTPGSEIANDLFREVVRGERPWTDLRQLGMTIQLEGNLCEVQNPPDLNPQVDIHDLAQGLVTHFQDPRGLREWAFVMEAVEADFYAEDYPAGDTVLTALWDASFGNPISPEVRAT